MRPELHPEHHCHATDCTVPIERELFMCKKHWAMVPAPIKKRIYAAYRPGQCEDMRPSKQYCDAAKAGVIAVAAKEGIQPNTMLYDIFSPRD